MWECYTPVHWSTLLLAGRSLVRDQMRTFNFFNLHNCSSRSMPLIFSVPNINVHKKEKNFFCEYSVGSSTSHNPVGLHGLVWSWLSFSLYINVLGRLNVKFLNVEPTRSCIQNDYIISTNRGSILLIGTNITQKNTKFREKIIGKINNIHIVDIHIFKKISLQQFLLCRKLEYGVSFIQVKPILDIVLPGFILSKYLYTVRKSTRFYLSYPKRRVPLDVCSRLWTEPIIFHS
jgi:hypothetical protein